MFPNDAKTITTTISSDTTALIFDNESTILSVAIQQNVPSETIVNCGNDVVAKNDSTNYYSVPMSYECLTNINIQKTGNVESTVLVTYVPYLMSEIRPHYEPNYTIATSTDINIYGSMSAGEIMITLLLLFLIVIELFKTLAQSISNVNTKRKYIAYSNADVEIREDL